jgi:hypothetical protein
MHYPGLTASLAASLCPGYWTNAQRYAQRWVISPPPTLDTRTGVFNLVWCTPSEGTWTPPQDSTTSPPPTVYDWRARIKERDLVITNRLEHWLKNPWLQLIMCELRRLWAKTVATALGEKDERAAADYHAVTHHWAQAVKGTILAVMATEPQHGTSTSDCCGSYRAACKTLMNYLHNSRRPRRLIFSSLTVVAEGTPGREAAAPSSSY